MTKFKTWSLLILTVLFIIFVLQNTGVVSVRFLFWQVSMSNIILMPIIFVGGLITGIVIGKRDSFDHFS